MKILVAGGTGYLGKHVLTECAHRGHWVRALARNRQKLDEKKNETNEIIVGEITQPDSLRGCCDGMDVVFSSVGITKQSGKLTFRDVDFQGNVNLLKEAKQAGVKMFVYVSVFNACNLLHLDIVKAHEDFVLELRASGLEYRVIRPTGYFSDMEEFLKMAKKGRVFLFGSGHNKINPIHGADLAKFCLDTLHNEAKEVDIGGPDILSFREIAALAFQATSRKVKIFSVPQLLTSLLVKLVRLFHRHNGELLAFITTMSTTQVVAQNQTGTHHLKDHYNDLCRGDDS